MDGYNLPASCNSQPHPGERRTLLARARLRRRINFTKYIPAPKLLAPHNHVAVKDVYVNGAYYWKVEARDSASNVIVTSAARRFTRQMPLPLTSPHNGGILLGDPTFGWLRTIGLTPRNSSGINHYNLQVSTSPAFASYYDQVSLDYARYTPYTSGYKDVYANGDYYWRVTARDSGSNVIATSLVSTFAITSTGPTITPTTLAPITPTTTTVTPTPIITATPGITSTARPPTVTPGPAITNKKTWGNVTVGSSTGPATLLMDLAH